MKKSSLKMNQGQIAKILEEMAAILELKGENPFKVRAYLHAAHVLFNIQEDFTKLIEEDRLKEYKGIGDHLNEKILILAKTGTLPLYEELIHSLPHGLNQMMRVPGLGPKKIKALFEILNVDSIETLKLACLKGEVAKLPRFGIKTEQKILEGIQHLETYSKRHLWWEVVELARPILDQLRALKGVQKAEIAGSFRRAVETIGDLDYVVASDDPLPVMEWFITNPAVEVILAHGAAKSSVRLFNGIQAELRIVPIKQYAFALCYSTGSKNHNIKLRQIAREKDLSLSEWGLVSENPDIPDPFAKRKRDVTEADIYKALGMEYIPPELREDMGEIEAAKAGLLPHLVKEGDIRGAFHIHTTASDGKATCDAMAKAAEQLGWEYLGITDHSKSSIQANGLDENRLMEQVAQIRRINASKQYKLHLFSGVECDILPDGTLDFANDILMELDFVIVSVHSVMKQDEKTMTKRIIKAIENPYTTIVGHLTGRLLLRREPYPVDILKVVDCCIANGKIIEINASPWRLDLDWRFWHKASEKGLMSSVNPDAHDTKGLQHVRAGINVARKGWLEKKQILNTYSLSGVKKKFLQIRP